MSASDCNCFAYGFCQPELESPARVQRRDPAAAHRSHATNSVPLFVGLIFPVYSLYLLVHTVYESVFRTKKNEKLSGSVEKEEGRCADTTPMKHTHPCAQNTENGRAGGA